MAKRKAKEETPSSIYPRIIDDEAKEVEEGFVELNDLPGKLIPLEVYQQRKRAQDEELKQEDNQLGNEVRVFIRDYLRSIGRGELQFQEGCRQLSYALQELHFLDGMPFYTGLPNTLPDVYHQEHLIRAVYAVSFRLKPVTSGKATLYYARQAKNEEQRLRERVRMWRALHVIIQGVDQGQTRVKREKGRDIFHELDEIKEQLTYINVTLEKMLEKVMS